MNGVLKILKADGIRQQIVARCIRSTGYKWRPNDLPPNQEEGKFVQVNERLVKIPPPPTTCCMSGCANCVYIAYAEEVTKIFHDGHLPKEIILKHIDDPNMKCFLSMELRNAENKWAK
ncbi:hypothetical protein HA402_000109 [Bradysia odoriphaga]|nr:hypothetical protein HA402_000109 [Bradysia odoriphaga]